MKFLSKFILMTGLLMAGFSQLITAMYNPYNQPVQPGQPSSAAEFMGRTTPPVSQQAGTPPPVPSRALKPPLSTQAPAAEVKQAAAAPIQSASGQVFSGSAYIKKIINNTKQRITLEYSVPCNITPISATNSTGMVFKGIGAFNAGVSLSPYGKCDIHIYNGVTFSLDGAYIPKAHSPGDFKNVLILKTGSISGFANDLVLASIRISDGYLEKIYPNKPSDEPKKLPIPIRIFNERLMEGSNYTLEVKQVSDELYFNDPRTGKIFINPEAFQIIFTKN